MPLEHFRNCAPWRCVVIVPEARRGGRTPFIPSKGSRHLHNVRTRTHNLDNTGSRSDGREGDPRPQRIGCWVGRRVGMNAELLPPQSEVRTLVVIQPSSRVRHVSESLN
jgi:hypothetical protein